MATTYGFDISHYQAFNGHFGAAKRQGYRFVMAKCTEGAGWRDPLYARFRANAKIRGLLFAAYHFLDHGDAAGQAANLARHIGDKSVPVMIDLEAHGATLADAKAFRAECKKRGIRVSLLYLPHWYWERIGRPSLRGWKVVSSAYPSSAHKIGSALYPGVKGSGWKTYGGVKPVIWQFASTGRIEGYRGNVDVNAFNGTLASLKKLGLFKDYAHHKAKKPKVKKPNSRGPNVDSSLASAKRAVPAAKKHPRVLARLRAAIKSLTAIKPTKRKK